MWADYHFRNVQGYFGRTTFEYCVEGDFDRIEFYIRIQNSFDTSAYWIYADEIPVHAAAAAAG